jgi:hypothetical protein
MAKTILVDFDGVLHSYESGWQGVDQIADPPVPGAIEWLKKLIDDERFSVCIYSSRSKYQQGILAMIHWLYDQGLTAHYVDQIQFPKEKPAAFLTIDDRAICFEGVFPDLGQIADFQPWNKKDFGKGSAALMEQPYIPFHSIPDDLAKALFMVNGDESKLDQDTFNRWKKFKNEYFKLEQDR